MAHGQLGAGNETRRRQLHITSQRTRWIRPRLPHSVLASSVSEAAMQACRGRRVELLGTRGLGAARALHDDLYSLSPLGVGTWSDIRVLLQPQARRLSPFPSDFR
jgi:hypothetical protein